MTQIAISSPVPLSLHLGDALRLSDDELFELCARNRDLHIERTAEGDLIVMSPAGGESSHRNAEIVFSLTAWAKRDGSGFVFDSSGGFLLPNGALRSPDAAWVLRSRLDAVPKSQRQRFLPVCPDFVVELRSASDRLADVEAKLEEYRDNGARLGWLIDPVEQRVYVYRPGKSVSVVDRPLEISGEPDLPGFVLDLRPVWASI